MNQALSPSDLKPDYDYLPFNHTLSQIGSGIIGTAVIVMVSLFVVGCVMVVVGKMGDRGGVTKVGIGFIVFSLVIVALVANSGRLTEWATTLDLFGDSETGGAALMLLPGVGRML